MPVFGSDQDDDIDAWMAQRNQDVADRDQNAAAGQAAWAASTATGDNLQAPNPSDVTALGVDSQGQDAAARTPIRRGDKATLSDDTKARILMNEFRSYSGPGTQQAIVNGAHALMNADEALGADRPETAKPAKIIPQAEAPIFKTMQDAVSTAKAQRAQGIDPTNGAQHFRFWTDDRQGPWMGFPLRTQIGPLHNSFTYGDVPSSTAWANTYQE